MYKNPFVSAHILCLLIIEVVKTAFRHFELPLAVACLFAASGTRCAPVSGNFKKLYISGNEARFRRSKAAFRNFEAAFQKFETPLLFWHI